MSEIKERLTHMVNGIAGERPVLAHMATETPLIDYLRPAVLWNPNARHFPFRPTLQGIIVNEIDRLYDGDYASQAREQLSHSWGVETGAHLSLPRRFDKVSKPEGYQVNPLVFQGQMFWVLTSLDTKLPLSISMSTGRVPLDNANSGAYIDLPSLESPVNTAVRKRYEDTPQILIPAVETVDLDKKRQQLTTLMQQKKLPKEEHQIAMAILDNFAAHQTSFGDQVATSHALMFDKMLPPEIRQVTLDSERIGTEFLITLLEDPSSLVHQTFSNPVTRKAFLDHMSGISTGWAMGESPFYAVVRRKEAAKFARYEGEETPEVLAKGLKDQEIWATGVLKFFAMMIEGGLCPIGGMNQSGYCTDIRDRSVQYLITQGQVERAQALSQMPTPLATISPAWGVKHANGQASLAGVDSFLLQGFSSDEIARMKAITGSQALATSGPVLYNFLTGEQPPLDYNDLVEHISSFGIVR